ncbi:MAG: C40 family peptidase [Cytophagales bacterium]|nr:C40 family peptidase [Cytophagales bacterium]
MKNYRHHLIIFLIGLLSILVSCHSSKPSNGGTNDLRGGGASTHIHPKAHKAIKTAQSYKGTKYKFGGTTKKGIDCSGLMCTSYKSAGITLPRTSRDQSNHGKRVYIGSLQPGDLVFFGASPKSKKVTHVGMVTRASKSKVTFIHASSSSGVVESDLFSAYYKPRFIKAMRPPLGKGKYVEVKTKKKGKTKSKNKTKKKKDKPKKSTLSKKNRAIVRKVLKTANSYKGTKYKFGGMSKKGMDCSGLVCASYKKAGITLPRTCKQQSTVGKRIYIGELQPGDLVFFGANPGSTTVNHVGIIKEVTNHKIIFIHASTTNGVIESDLTSPDYRPRYIKAVRPTEK